MCAINRILKQELATKVIGDHNTKISGGEAQRICLARVLYQDPPILILDEPTAQLDFGSSKELISMILDVTENKTVILVTHQVNLLKNMDRIILLQNGEIVDEGQYDTLYGRNEFFRTMVGS